MLKKLGPKTWVLVTIAAWAIATWLLAVAGLGSTIVPLSAVGPSPMPVASHVFDGIRMRPPQSDFGATNARPLFNEDRRPQPFFIDAVDGVETPDAFRFVLTSVLLSPTFRMAIVQPQEGGAPSRLKLGEAPATASAWTLAAIESRRAVFNGPDGQRTLELRVFDGVGGEPPTPDAAGRAALARTPPPVKPASQAQVPVMTPPPQPDALPPTVLASGETVDTAAIDGNAAQSASISSSANKSVRPVQSLPSR